MYRSAIHTPWGTFTAQFTTSGLAKLEFPRRHTRPRSPPRQPPSPEAARWRELTAAALERILAGSSPGPLPPLDLSVGTPFQRQVWVALEKIPRGATRTYSDVARAVGRAKAVRAVGQACAANPIPVFVPCHRVVAGDGGLGGFSAGLAWKRRLLEAEREDSSRFSSPTR